METGITTIEGLAELIQRTMSSKEDIKEVTVRIDKIDTRIDNLDARVARIQADVSELRGEIVYRHEFEDVLGRVKYLERKMGIESGVSA